MGTLTLERWGEWTTARGTVTPVTLQSVKARVLTSRGSRRGRGPGEKAEQLQVEGRRIGISTTGGKLSSEAS